MLTGNDANVSNCEYFCKSLNNSADTEDEERFFACLECSMELSMKLLADACEVEMIIGEKDFDTAKTFSLEDTHKTKNLQFQGMFENV